MQRVQLITLWLICCTCCCLGLDNTPSDQSSSSSSLSTTTQQHQQPASATSTELDIQNSVLLSSEQFIRLKRSIKRVIKDMRNVENSLLETELDRNKLIELHRKALEHLKSLDRKVQTLCRSNGDGPCHLAKKQDDSIQQNLEITNQIKKTQDPKFFSSSSSSQLRPQSVFSLVDARSASETGNSSPLVSGNSSSSVNYSSNFTSSNATSSQASITHSPSAAGNGSRIDDTLARKLVTAPKKSILDLEKNDKIIDANIFLNNLNDDNVNHKLEKIKNKSNNLNKFSNHEFSTIERQNTQQRFKKRKQKFLLYHKCSEGYLQIGDNDTLNTGMDTNLLANSDFQFNYLTKTHNHQLQLQTKEGKFLCLDEHGRPKIMNELHSSLCTFDIVYHQNEYLQLKNVWNVNWTLGFNRKGIPMRITSHRRKSKKTKPNPCTLFIRLRPDEHRLDYFNKLKNAHQKSGDQNKEIDINSVLNEDLLIISKLEQLRNKAQNN